jgi:hypothetical protein
MKVYCPKCSANVSIGSHSRFCIFKCDECSYEFRGIHADINFSYNSLRGLARIFIPLYFIVDPPSYLDPEETACPYCWEIVNLSKASGVGYDAPKICRSCRERLPRKRV